MPGFRARETVFEAKTRLQALKFGGFHVLRLPLAVRKIPCLHHYERPESDRLRLEDRGQHYYYAG